MKAVYLVRKGEADRAFEIRETPKPVCGPGQVLIKVACFGLNYAEVMARNGLYRDAPEIPGILGYEVAGTIAETGSGIDPSLKGKRVVAFTRFGGYAEYAVTAGEAFVEIGDMDFGEACCVAVQFATAYYMAYEQTNLRAGDTVLVHAGAGGVGTALIQLCKLKGCHVIATAGSAEKLEYMRAIGADRVFNYREGDYVAFIRTQNAGQKPDVIFNPMGGKSFKKDLGLLGSGGRVILFGGSERSGKKLGLFSTLGFVYRMGFILPIVLMMKSQSLIGVNMLRIGDDKPQVLRHCMLNCLELVRAGKLKPHVGARFKVQQIAEAHTLLESRKSIGKIAINWE